MPEMIDEQELMNGLLIAHMELLKAKYPDIHAQACRIYANTTKWQRNLNAAEIKTLIDWSFMEMNKRHDSA